MNLDYEMTRVNRVINHVSYREYLVRLKEYEKERKFCCHNISHFLDVARIAYIINLKMQLDINIELIYSAALLHDIGKAVNSERDREHNKISARLAKPILYDCGFLDWEVECIVVSILNHNRAKKDESVNNLADILYRADKLSRPCYMCSVQDICYWKLENKNLWLKI